ncbi:hypothetical protein [Paenibacillus sp. LBL]|uniref:hypothetical protein n=1 Tax=Paenibacillus sp. LBL TaxID=2940563 RepID=UPI002473F571|nr:hypothetical protein [Paenibacillus sp. LBL]
MTLLAVSKMQLLKKRKSRPSIGAAKKNNLNQSYRTSKLGVKYGGIVETTRKVEFADMSNPRYIAQLPKDEQEEIAAKLKAKLLAEDLSEFVVFKP